jgi:hypothetical protein
MIAGRRWLHLAPLALLAGSCDLLPPTVCTTEARAGVSVEIRDAATARPLADSATVMVTEGSFSDTLHLCGMTDDYFWVSRCGLEERAGTYGIEVSRPGYRPWSQSGVRVRRGECHVQTAVLRALLAAAP